jgi:hypothetical protein
MTKSCSKILDWLYENAGPVIRLRLIREFDMDTTAEERTLAEVIDLPETQFWLQNLEISRRVHDAHCDRLENIAGKLYQLGLTGQLNLLEPYMDDWKYRLSESLNDTAYFSGYKRAMLCACFWMLGYRHKALRDVARRRLDVLYDFCRKGDYDIYLPENYFGDLPGQRAGKPLVNPDLYPDGTVKLPSIYDMIWFPMLYDGDPKNRIDTIIAYILQSGYQNGIRPGYGNIRAGKRHYYGMGWSVHVPGFNGIPPADPRELVLYLELLATFAPAIESDWFASAISYLDSYRTNEGAWRFPPDFLIEKGKSGGYYVLGYHMGLGENRRKKIALELESTFRMLHIYKLAGRI